MTASKPHVLAIDEGPFVKGQREEVPLVAVMTAGAHQVETVATSAFGVDAEGVTEFLAEWICSLRCHAALQAVMLGGITMVGLALVDSRELSRRTQRPIIVVTRRDPAQSRVGEALESAGLTSRLAILERTPKAVAFEPGLFVAPAGIEPADACRIVAATIGKARVPEPLRLAHLIARALVDGESRGRA